MEEQIYYRPIWTCGRYNEEKQVAIYYNLIAGMSYFFESYSAMVIGEILAVLRNGKIDIKTIATKLNIAVESLTPFFEQLKQMGLVTVKIPNESDIKSYRNIASSQNKKEMQGKQSLMQDIQSIGQSDAEMMYSEKVGGVNAVMFELTYNCSEKCIHCYNIGATRNEDEISFRGHRNELGLNDYKRIIDEFYDLGIVRVCLTGGDPFSKSIIWEIIDYLYNKEIAIDIFTNGQRLLGHEEKLANYFPRVVGISIYSGEAEVHDYITRVKGSWKKSMNCLKRLSELGVSLYVKCCVLQPNFKSYWQVADIALKHGAMPQYEVSIMNSLDGDMCASRYLRLEKEQLEIVLRDPNVPLWVDSELTNYGSFKRNLGRNGCGVGNDNFCVTPEGKITLCCSFHSPIGDLTKTSVKETLENNKSLEWWRNLTLNDYEECGRHDYCDFCNLCPGINFSEHGTPLKASETCCYMAKVRYELAQKLRNGQDPLNGKNISERVKDFVDYKPVKIRRIMSQDFSSTKLKN